MLGPCHLILTRLSFVDFNSFLKHHQSRIFPMIPNLDIPIAGGLNVALPKMAQVRQRFDDSRLDDVGQTVGEQMQRSESRDRVRPGMKIAIGAGSRGIANIAEAVKAVVQGLKEQGAEPFISQPWAVTGARMPKVSRLCWKASVSVKIM